MDITTTIQQTLLPDLPSSPPQSVVVPLTVCRMAWIMDEVMRLEQWSTWADAIREHFPQAVEAKILRESNYDDEGGYYYSTDEVQVFDVTGVRLDTELDAVAHDAWRECCYELPTPTDDWCEVVFSVLKPRRVVYTHEEVLNTLTKTRDWILSLPSSLFAPPSDA